MITKEHVYVGMSGGVDSAVAAALLLDMDYQVTGINMLTWIDPNWEAGFASQEKMLSLAEQVTNQLRIRLVVLDVQKEFRNSVIKPFIADYLSGKTPNPCLFCNPQVKWGILQRYALGEGANYFATGHYAKLVRSGDGMVHLFKALDKEKDQSYVLSMLSQNQLNATLLPLGNINKHDVRQKARELGLPSADLQESQDLCFLGDSDYRDFLQRFSPETIEKGPIVDVQGEVLGEHEGLPFYTIGQRKGIRIASTEPYYVVAKDFDKNTLVIGFKEQTGRVNLRASNANWISGNTPEINKEYDVMVRYRTKPEPANLISVTKNKFRLEFKHSLRDITPGQVAALYCNEECLGGGVIEKFGQT
jgi:tRNA-specific 2-thiouridylase